jgi:hypothetical protein
LSALSILRPTTRPHSSYVQVIAAEPPVRVFVTVYGFSAPSVPAET